MACEDKPKRRRVMIISGDESIIDEIKNSKNASLCKSLILETQDEDMEILHPEVKIGIFFFSLKFLLFIDQSSTIPSEENKN
jgi:hypothetical protein